MTLTRPGRRIRTRVRRPTRLRPARVTTTTGFRTCPAGFAFGVSCPVDDHAVELVTAGRPGVFETRAVIRCPECRGEYLLAVQLLPATHQPRTGLNRDQLDQVRRPTTAAGAHTAGPVRTYAEIPLGHKGPPPTGAARHEMTADAAHRRRKTLRARGLTLALVR